MQRLRVTGEKNKASVTCQIPGAWGPYSAPHQYLPCCWPSLLCGNVLSPGSHETIQLPICTTGDNNTKHSGLPGAKVCQVSQAPSGVPGVRQVPSEWLLLLLWLSIGLELSNHPLSLSTASLPLLPHEGSCSRRFCPQLPSSLIPQTHSRLQQQPPNGPPSLSLWPLQSILLWPPYFPFLKHTPHHITSHPKVHIKTTLFNMAHNDFQTQVRLHLEKCLPHLKSPPPPLPYILQSSHNRQFFLLSVHSVLNSSASPQHRMLWPPFLPDELLLIPQRPAQR